MHNKRKNDNLYLTTETSILLTCKNLPEDCSKVLQKNLPHSRTYTVSIENREKSCMLNVMLNKSTWSIVVSRKFMFGMLRQACHHNMHFRFLLNCVQHLRQNIGLQWLGYWDMWKWHWTLAFCIVEENILGWLDSHIQIEQILLMLGNSLIDMFSALVWVPLNGPVKRNRRQLFCC